MPGRHLGFATDDAAPLFGPAKLPFLLAGNLQVCELVDDFLARVGARFFLRSFFHIISVNCDSCLAGPSMGRNGHFLAVRLIARQSFLSINMIYARN